MLGLSGENSLWFGLLATISAYGVALVCKKVWPRSHPLVVTSSLLIGLLLIARIPYDTYKPGGDLIAKALGPVTVALAVPLYKNAAAIKKALLPVLAGITAGSVAAIISSAVIMWAMGSPMELLLSMLPKSVTTPIAMEIGKQLGGIPALTASFTVLTGLLGSIIGPAYLRRIGIREDLTLGVAIGTSSHGIGTARLIGESELQVAAGGFAMGLAGIITSVLMIPLYYFLG